MKYDDHICYVLVDSGAAVHVRGKDFAEQFGIDNNKAMKLEGAGGHNLKHYGQRIVDGNVNGVGVSIRFQVADVEKPILSICFFCRKLSELLFRSA